MNFYRERSDHACCDHVDMFFANPICNGILREKWYKKIYGERVTYLIGSVIVSVMFVIFIYAFFGSIYHTCLCLHYYNWDLCGL